jgi:hypothetical protein
MFRPMKAIIRENLVAKKYIYFTVLSSMCLNKVNTLKTERICFMYGLRAYRDVNTLH